MKKTKDEVNYRLPDKCCARCTGACYNSYGDSVCTKLEAGTTIDAGGICDLYDEETYPVRNSDG